jgi:hypothetical protein
MIIFSMCLYFGPNLTELLVRLVRIVTVSLFGSLYIGRSFRLAPSYPRYFLRVSMFSGVGLINLCKMYLGDSPLKKFITYKLKITRNEINDLPLKTRPAPVHTMEYFFSVLYYSTNSYEWLLAKYCGIRFCMAILVFFSALFNSRPK